MQPSARRIFAWTSPTNAPRPGGSIHVFDHNHSRRRNREDVVPPIGAVVVIVGLARLHARAGAPHACGRGVARHRRLILENALYARIGEARVRQAHTESFNCACNETSAEAAELLQLCGFQGSCWHKIARSIWLADLEICIHGAESTNVPSCIHGVVGHTRCHGTGSRASDSQVMTEESRLFAYGGADCLRAA